MQKARFQKLEKAEILEMCVEFVKQSGAQIKTMKQNYEYGYQQCTQDVHTFLHHTPEIPVPERQRLLNHLSNTNTRRYQPYRTPQHTHSTIVNDWFHRCGGSNNKQNPSIDSSNSERSNASSPSSIDDYSERSSSSTSSSLSSSLWRPW